MKLVLGVPLLRIVFRPRLHGAANVPRRGPVILASNHLSFIDPVVLAILIRRRVHFLAASSYYARRGAAGWIMRRFLTATGMPPIDRTGGAASEASLRSGLHILGRGEVLGIFPEGSRSRDGRLHRGRTGVARLAALSGVPVVPVAVRGTDDALPPDRGVLPRVRPITVRVGPPLRIREGTDQNDRAALREFTERVMSAIRALGDLDYVDEYSRRPETH